MILEEKSIDTKFYACISSRITTGIHVVVLSIKEIIADIMSSMQFHNINAYT